jgi:hypothetical protein
MQEVKATTHLYLYHTMSLGTVEIKKSTPSDFKFTLLNMVTRNFDSIEYA